MATIIVGIGEFAVSSNPEDVLKTFGLGSCVGVIIHDPDKVTTGLLHLVLPESKTNPAKAANKPGYFADTGIKALVDAMEGQGLKKSRRWVVKLAGGAKVLQQVNSEQLQIGKRNVLATKKILWKLGLGAIAEDVGKEHSRTVSVDVGTALVTVVNQKIGNITL